MDEVAPQPGDVVIDKLRPSFFVFTALEPVLMNIGVTRLLIGGLQTNVCVEATARSALAHNYEVAVAEDAVSTDGPDLHHAALNSMRVLYTEVAPWRDLLADGAVWDRAFTTELRPQPRLLGRDLGIGNDTQPLALLARLGVMASLRSPREGDSSQ